jgi:hypothetical protein
METKKIDLIETSSTKEAELARNFLRQLKPIGVKFSEAKEDGNTSKVAFRAWVNLPDPRPARPQTGDAATNGIVEVPAATNGIPASEAVASTGV